MQEPPSCPPRKGSSIMTAQTRAGCSTEQLMKKTMILSLSKYHCQVSDCLFSGNRNPFVAAFFRYHYHHFFIMDLRRCATSSDNTRLTGLYLKLLTSRYQCLQFFQISGLTKTPPLAIAAKNIICSKVTKSLPIAIVTWYVRTRTLPDEVFRLLLPAAQLHISLQNQNLW